MRRADALRDQLEQDIVTGTLRPGERLDEQGLAVRFGVSRTPIREALMQLATAGLVTLQPRRGAFVASLSLKDYHTLRMLRLTMKVFFILGLARISGGY